VENSLLVLDFSIDVDYEIEPTRLLFHAVDILGGKTK